MGTLRTKSVGFALMLIPALAFGQLGGGGPAGVSPEAGEPFPWETGIRISPYSIANLYNGNVLTAIELVAPVETVGEPFRFVLYHNSAEALGSLTVPQGSMLEPLEGWGMTYGGCVIDDAGNNRAYLVEDTGLMKEFTLSGGAYVAQTGVYDKLVRDDMGTPSNPADDQWIVTRPNEHKRLFDADGRLLEVRSSNLQHDGLPFPIERDGSNYIFRMRIYPDYAGFGGFSWGLSRTYSGNDLVMISLALAKCDPENQEIPDPIRRYDLHITNNRIDRIEWFDEFKSDGNGGFVPASIDITYDSSGRILTIADKNENEYTYAYNTAGQIATVTDPSPYSSQTQTFSYSLHTGGAWKTLYKDRANKSWSYIFQSWGGLKEIWNPSPLSSQKRYFTYDSSYNRTSFKNELNQQWNATYDSAGNLLTLTNPLGQKTAFTYDTANQLNNLLTITPASDSSGNTDSTKRIELEYDDVFGSPPAYADKTHATSIIEPADGQGNSAATTSLTWNTAGSFSWDQAPGRIEQVLDPEGVATKFEYQSLGSTINSGVVRTEGEGDYLIQESFYYDCSGRDIASSGPMSGGGLARFIDSSSDGCGTGLSVVETPNSQSCPEDQQLGGSDPPIPTVEPYAWPLAEEECCDYVNQPSCDVHDDECSRGCMDGMYRPTRYREPHKSPLATGSSNTSIDVSQRIDEMQYDELGRLREWRARSSIPASTTEGTTPTYGPDIDRTFTLVPTANGQLDTLTDADLTVTDFDYDAASRLTSISVTTNGGSATTIVSYTLDAAGRPSAASYVNGTSTTWSYTAAGQVDVITHKLGSTILLALDYNYTPDGLIDEVDQTIGSTTWTMEYDYDKRNRLIAEYGQLAPTDPSGSPPANQPTSVDREYTYDQVGNRLTEADGVAGTTTVYHYDVHDPYWDDVSGGHAGTRANRLLASVKTLNSTSAVVEKVWYLYNAAGHVKRLAKHNPGEDATLYKLLCLDYDRNQMLWLARGYEVTVDGETSCTDATFAREFRYDAEGRRRYWSRERVPGTLAIPSGTEGDGWREYLGQSVYADLDVDPATGASVVRRQYVHASDGRLIGWREGSNWHIVHADHLGSTRLVTGPSGSRAAGYGYSAFGELLAAATPGGSSATSRYGYCGGWGYENDLMGDDGTSGGGSAAAWAGEFGLLHVGARFYAPSLGRFVQRDPISIEGDLCVYAYCGSDPLSYVDPTGFETLANVQAAAGIGTFLGTIGYGIARTNGWSPSGNAFIDSTLDNAVTYLGVVTGRFAITAACRAVGRGFEIAVNGFYGRGMQNPPGCQIIGKPFQWPKFKW